MFTAPVALAQSSSGALEGTVRDETAAVISGRERRRIGQPDDRRRTEGPSRRDRSLPPDRVAAGALRHLGLAPGVHHRPARQDRTASRGHDHRRFHAGCRPRVGHRPDCRPLADGGRDQRGPQPERRARRSCASCRPRASSTSLINLVPGVAERRRLRRHAGQQRHRGRRPRHDGSRPAGALAAARPELGAGGAGQLTRSGRLGRRIHGFVG